MNEINIELVRTQLEDFVQGYKAPLRGKLAVLFPLRSQILGLNTKGAKSGDISTILAQFGVTASKDTVARFIRLELKNEKAVRSKKGASAPSPHSNITPDEQAVKKEAQPGNYPAAPKAMMPRI